MQKQHITSPYTGVGMREKKTFSKYRTPLSPVPNLVENQIVSYEKFLKQDLARVIKDFSPITDYSEKKFELVIKSVTLSKPEIDVTTAKQNKVTYEGQVKAEVVLKNKTFGTEKTQEIFLTDLPLMTSNGTFVINGVERAVVPQLIRTFGVSFNDRQTRKGHFFGAKIIPERGAWIEIESEYDDVIYVRIDKKRKFPVTSFLRVLGLQTDEQIIKAFKNETALEYIKTSLAKDVAKNTDEAYVEIYRKLRDGEVASPENAREFFDSIINSDRYNISTVGRYHFNKRFNKGMTETDLAAMTITQDDLVVIIEKIAVLNTDPKAKPDDIDHLGWRRVRFVGEQIEMKIRKGMLQLRRNIQDKMSTIESETILPIQIINQRPLQARIKEFFSQSQLSQFGDQINMLSELEHMRRLTAMGPGGLTRERASFEVRDLHTSHYGRICPIHTPEGPNIGLVLQMALYARINDFGMIETPYVRVKNGKITGEIVYMNATDEERYTITHAAVAYDKNGTITDDIVSARIKTLPGFAHRSEVDFIDVSSNQAFSVAAALIPFLEHDDSKRTLMGANMQKQAIPCMVPMAPLVATGIEEDAARDTGRMLISESAGTVVSADGVKIDIKDSKGKIINYPLETFTRTNQSTVYNQRPIVSVGDKVSAGQVIADAATTDGGQLAIGQNILVAFLCLNGANYEDAIIISERLVKNSIFSSIHIDEYECVVRDTKLGEEQTTRDIPNVGEARLKDLDDDGIVRIGAEVREGDILVGKITPKGEIELTPEERLLRSIFGEKVRDVKDTSMRIDHGVKGRVIGVKIFSRDNGHELESGILKKIYIEVAQTRNIQVGDKLAGRHGNKGVISTVLPEEDMPYMENGQSVDLVLTSLGVSSRMNLGQILEMHLGLAAGALGYQAIAPAFGGANVDEIGQELQKAGLPENGKVTLYDGRTGQAYAQDVAVGYMYMLKLNHMVDDKMHARSVGPYSLITQQPLGGKSQSGGQRFGEMEVWALEGYGAAYTLREMLTIKSDDIIGRTAAFDAIIKGEKIPEPGAPAAFKVMLSYLRGLSLDVKLEGAHREYTEIKGRKVDIADIDFDIDGEDDHE